jgi:hypothetical protein
MGNLRFSSSTPGRDRVGDRYWLPLEPGWVAWASSSGERRGHCYPRNRRHPTADRGCPQHFYLCLPIFHLMKRESEGLAALPVAAFLVSSMIVTL